MSDARINEILTEVKEVKEVLERGNLFESEKDYYRGKLTGLNFTLSVFGYSDL